MIIKESIELNFLVFFCSRKIKSTRTDLHWKRNFLFFSCVFVYGKFWRKQRNQFKLFISFFLFKVFLLFFSILSYERRRQEVLFNNNSQTVRRKKKFFPFVVNDRILFCHLFHDFSFIWCWIFNALERTKLNEELFFVCRFLPHTFSIYQNSLYRVMAARFNELILGANQIQGKKYFNPLYSKWAKKCFEIKIKVVRCWEKGRRDFRWAQKWNWNFHKNTWHFFVTRYWRQT